MTTSRRVSGIVGYNAQVVVDTKHHLIITHEVTNVGTHRSQLSHVAKETKVALEATSLDVIADRGYFNGEGILACEKAGITVTVPKPMTSNAKAAGRFGKQTSDTWSRRTLTSVRLARGSPPATQTRKMDCCSAATERMEDRHACPWSSRTR